MVKALLISTLIGWLPPSTGGTSINSDQMYIWFEGPSAHADCDRTKTALAIGSVTAKDGQSVSSKAVTGATVERTVECIKFQ